MNKNIRKCRQKSWKTKDVSGDMKKKAAYCLTAFFFKVIYFLLISEEYFNSSTKWSKKLYHLQ